MIIERSTQINDGRDECDGKNRIEPGHKLTQFFLRNHVREHSRERDSHQHVVQRDSVHEGVEQKSYAGRHRDSCGKNCQRAGTAVHLLKNSAGKKTRHDADPDGQENHDRNHVKRN